MWLILVIVLLFTCFPAAFSAIAITLHIPLSLMLIGIVLRGSAFIFRSYGSDRRRDAAAVGTRVRDREHRHARAARHVRRCDRDGRHWLDDADDVGDSFVDHFIAPWLTLFGFGVGLLALALFSFLAAVYLTVEAHGTALQEDFRTRALWAAARCS